MVNTLNPEKTHQVGDFEFYPKKIPKGLLLKRYI